MPFDWSEYLTLAEELALRKTEEAAIRSAISRAYYAGFNLARIRLEQTNVLTLVDPRLGSHEVRWKAYREHVDPRCRNIGINGDRLRAQRIRADYRDTMSNAESELTTAILRARGIKTSLRDLPANLP